MPNINEDFTGRDKEINKVTKAVVQIRTNKRNNVVISALNGMPAVGKTTLAIYIARLLEKEYSDGQLYIDCYGYTKGKLPLSSEQILDSLLLSLRIPKDYIPYKIDDKIAFWRSYLHDKKLIIILDNINSEEQVKSLLPGNSMTLILITSRNHLLDFSNSYTFNIDVLSLEESISLLEKTSGFSSDKYKDLFEKVAKKCGCLPLALRIIGSRLRGRKSINLLNRFIESNDTISSLSRTENAVYESFDLSYILLHDNEKQLLKSIAILPIANITPLTCSFILNINISEAAYILDSLYEKSLITETGNEIYRLHDLLREFACKKFDNENSTQSKSLCIGNLLTMYFTLLYQFNTLLYPNDYCYSFTQVSYSNKIFDFADISDALLWYDIELDNLISLLDYLDANDFKSQYIICSHLMSVHLRRCLSSSSLLRIQCKALTFSQKIDDVRYKAVAYNDAALAYMQVGDFKSSIKHFEKAVEYWKFLGDDLGLANSLANNGFALERLGNYGQAIAILDNALEIHRVLKNDYGIAFVLNAKGAVTWRQKDYSTAKEIFEEALSLRINLNDKIGISSTKNNLGFTFLKLNMPRDALIYFEESIDISKEYNDVHGQSVTTNNLGYYNIFIKDFDEAIKYATKARCLAESVGDLYQIGRSYDVEANAYIKLNKKDDAKKVLHKAKIIFDELRVPEAYEVEALLKNLFSL